MKDDLTDHFCCVVEDELRKGTDFEVAYNKAYYNICPNGFDEIQRETVFLVNEKKMKTMKKTLYLLGLLATVLISSGFMMKLMHWPGANVVMLGGMLVALLGVLPILFAIQYKQEINKFTSDKWRLFLGYTSAAFILYGIVSKMLHLQGAGVALVVGVFLLNFGFLPLLFFKMYKKSES